MRTTGLVAATMVSAALVLSAAMVSHAGPLNPPAGAPAATYKTLSEIEPRIAISATSTPGDSDSLFRITQPGSYYLTGNVQGVDNKKGIEVQSGGKVVLDLNGFTMTGSAQSQSAVYVDMGTSTNNGVHVRNGTMTAWTLGVETLVGSGMTVEDVVVYSCRATGIQVGSHSIVRNCVARSNGGNAGIQISGSGLVEGCVADDNTSAGIFATASGTVIRGCAARGNGGVGVLCGLSSTVVDCEAALNGDDGFQASNNASITRCGSSGNNGDGIQVGTTCMVVESLCTGNGAAGDGAGIHATGADNRIEGNNCSQADRGIDVDVGGNFIARNTCSGNTTNYAITGTQTIGPIITATGTITSTNPWANFEY